MKNIKRILFFMLLSCGILTCTGGKANVKNTAINDKAASEENKLKELRAKAKKIFPDMIDYDKISPKYFGKDRDYVFTMRFSNIIYESHGKIIKVPVFRGTMGDALYQDFLKYCDTKGLMKKEYVESGFEVKFKKGEFKKVFGEFRNLYERCLSISFKMPTDVSAYSEKEQISTYAFVLDGVEGELSFYYPYDEYEDEATSLLYFISIR